MTYGLGFIYHTKSHSSIQFLFNSWDKIGRQLVNDLLCLMALGSFHYLYYTYRFYKMHFFDLMMLE